MVRENELLADMFDRALAPVDLIVALGRERSDYLREAFSHLLVEQADSGAPGITYTVEELAAPPVFKSVLYEKGGYAGSRALLVFNFGIGFSDTALPLAGLLIALFSGPLALASAVAALGIAKTLWSKLVILRSPQNDDAISLLKSLAVAKEAEIRHGFKTDPTWQVWLSASGINDHSAVNALKFLNASKIITASEWGDQAGDLENPENRWRVCL